MDIEINGFRLYWTEDGSGKPLVLVHGYPLDHTIWDPVVPALSRSARVIRPDLRGHGRSPAPAAVISMQRLADDLLALLDALRIERAALVGHSMGGYACLAFARAYPDRLSGLALVASQARADTPEAAENRRKTAAAVGEQGTGSLADSMPGKLSADPAVQARVREIIVRANPNGVVGSLLGMADREDALGLLASLTIPTLVISGGGDQIIARERAEEMASSLPDVTWVEIPSAGHMPMLETPELVSSALLDFLDRV